MESKTKENTDFGELANSGSKWMFRDFFNSLSQKETVRPDAVVSTAGRAGVGQGHSTVEAG